jgi:hypothetical protein
LLLAGWRVVLSLSLSLVLRAVQRGAAHTRRVAACANAAAAFSHAPLQKRPLTRLSKQILCFNLYMSRLIVTARLKIDLISSEKKGRGFFWQLFEAKSRNCFNFTEIKESE